MRKTTIILLLLLAFTFLKAQHSYRVYFTDKGEKRELLDCPEKFLSPAAIARRAQQDIPITPSDLPVSSQYRKVIREMDFTIKARSRWFNFVTVHRKPGEAVRQLPFVRKVEPVRRYRAHLAGSANFDYGFSGAQLAMLDGIKVHDAGYTGKGKTIAVIDAGFAGSDTAVAFDSLRINGQLRGAYDFVGNDSLPYQGSSHGTLVLSVMATNLDGRMVGAAPHANYWLLRSEYAPTETPVELDNWLMAAEFADSVGADIINSSLGYSTFDNSDDDFQYSDLDGNTTLVTRAADKAAEKGILVVVSAGNEGASSWQYITAPADGDSVMAVGAVNSNRNYAGFSSIGPSADGRIKPDVAAQGQSTVITRSTGGVTSGSGTSFAAPLIAGMAACLWQALPSHSNMEIFQSILENSSLYSNPNNYLGYGIPNFNHARLGLSLDERQTNSDTLELYPVPVSDQLTLEFKTRDNPGEDLELTLWSPAGDKIWQTTRSYNPYLVMDFPFPPGIYILQLKVGKREYRRKVVK